MKPTPPMQGPSWVSVTPVFFKQCEMVGGDPLKVAENAGKMVVKLQFEARREDCECCVTCRLLTEESRKARSILTACGIEWKC